jgi:hypothetical protein
MKDKGIDKGLVKEFETSKKQFKGIFGFRKLFWDYLKKLNVPFSDPCCEDASNGAAPVAYLDGALVYWDAEDKEWKPVEEVATTTTTTQVIP